MGKKIVFVSKFLLYRGENIGLETFFMLGNLVLSTGLIK